MRLRAGCGHDCPAPVVRVTRRAYYARRRQDFAVQLEELRVAEVRAKNAQKIASVAASLPPHRPSPVEVPPHKHEAPGLAGPEASTTTTHAPGGSSGCSAKRTD